MMQLPSIDFSALSQIKYRSTQVERITAAGMPSPRKIFADEHLFYKLWPSHNLDARTVVWRGKRRLVENRNQHGNEVLLGFLYGLYDEAICPAFVDHIYDGPKLIGYVTRRGKPLAKEDEARPEFREFIGQFFLRSLRAGVVHRDLKARNIIEMEDGRLSLIDLECPLTLLNGYSPRREKKNGSLARFTSKRYRQLIKKYLDPLATNSKIKKARARIEKGPPDLFVLSPKAVSLSRTQ
jgi:hypothetical protein